MAPPGQAIGGLARTETNLCESPVIARDGFVITAAGFRDFARAILVKLLRGVTRPLA